MALLFMDGFDHYASADIPKKWTSSGAAYINSTGGRRSGGGYVVNNFHWISKSLSSSAATTIVGFALKPNATNGYPLLSLLESGTNHLSLLITAGAKLQLVRGNYSGTVLATGATALTTGVWYYVELKSTIHSSTGSYELRINTVTEFSATNANTRNGGTSGVTDTVQLGQSYAGGMGAGASYDDFYVCDASGSANNTFLGDCRIDTLLPNADGTYTQFTPSTGTLHYANVNKSTPSTTPNNASATSGNRDSYTFPALTSLASQSIYGVQINAATLKSDSGTRSLGTMSRLSGTNKDGSGAALGVSQVFISELHETDPAGNVWTQSNVNAAEFGVKVTV